MPCGKKNNVGTNGEKKSDSIQDATKERGLLAQEVLLMSCVYDCVLRFHEYVDSVNHCEMTKEQSDL